MEVETLRWFVAVGEGATVGDTARVFHRGQPAVTRGLQRLADEVGAPLTERIGRRLHLTYAGTALLPGVRRALAELDHAVQVVAEVGDPSGGTIRLGFLNPLGAWLVPELLTAFRSTHPRVRFDLRQDGSARILEALMAGDLDLLLASDPGSPELSFEQLFSEELVISVAATHPRAGAARLRAEDLGDEPWVVFPIGHGLRHHAEMLWREAGIEPVVAFEGHDLATLGALIAAGSGIGLFPASPESGAELRQVRLDPAVVRPVGLVTVPGRVTSPSVGAFIDLVRQRPRRRTIYPHRV